MIMTTTTQNQQIDRYLDFWNEPTAADQRRAATGTFTESVSYRAPVGLLVGAEALIGFKTDFTQHVGPARFVPRQDPEVHHGRARLPWEIRLPDGSSFATGTDILEFADDGLISGVSSFLDQPPEGFEHHA
jgi:hypothetical protein